MDEQHLHRRIAELEAHLRARDEFIAVAAHELRNPLMPMSIEVELLRRHCERYNSIPTDIRSSLERLQRSVDGFIRRAGVLLDVNRLVTGKLQLEWTQVDLSVLVSQIVTAAMPLAERSSCKLKLHLQEGVVGTWDRLAVEQIMENLLSNAIRYGAGAPVAVRVESDAHRARVLICDQGVGIAVEDQQRIFQRFEQAGTREPHSAGFGVGLWVARQLARRMGGDITVKSVPGQGATFTVALPLSQPQDGS
jgi:signal transduction histidine kinase